MLGIFTLGIYTLYWLYVTYRDTHEHLGRPHKAKLALTLAIIAFVLMWLALIVYFMAIFGLGMSGDNASVSGFAVGGLIGSVVFMLVASFAAAGIQVWMMWGAARGTEMVLQRYGRKAEIPPLVHALVPIVLNLWVYVAMGLIQNDLNKLHAEVQWQRTQAYPQA